MYFILSKLSETTEWNVTHMSAKIEVIQILDRLFKVNENRKTKDVPI